MFWPILLSLIGRRAVRTDLSPTTEFIPVDRPIPIQGSSWSNVGAHNLIRPVSLVQDHSAITMQPSWLSPFPTRWMPLPGLNFLEHGVWHCAAWQPKWFLRNGKSPIVRRTMFLLCNLLWATFNLANAYWTSKSIDLTQCSCTWTRITLWIEISSFWNSIHSLGIETAISIRAETYCNPRALIGRKGKDHPSSLHTRRWRPKGPKRTSWMEKSIWSPT